MKKLFYVITGVVLAAICFVTIMITGRTYTLKIKMYDNNFEAEKVEITLDQDSEVVRVKDKWKEGDLIYITLEPVSPGKFNVSYDYSDQTSVSWYLCVNDLGIITEGNYLGKCNGGQVIPIAVSIYLLIILVGIILSYRKRLRKNLYRYKNVTYLGLIIYITILCIYHLVCISSISSIMDMIGLVTSSAFVFALVVFPAAFILFVLVTISNINLIRHEGLNWRNMLGCMLGVLICLSTFFPIILSDYLQFADWIDVHNENGVAVYIDLFVENYTFVVLTYLECILLSTVILGIHAAKRIPDFDRDYILILGCQINKDGTLTNLLRGRADRAIEFAEMQEEKTGKKLKFVPSGGKGGDEVIAEGEAIRNYLLSKGISEDRILTETKSANTFENFRYSFEMIKKDFDGDDPKVAFSTTNYHVFRSGILASMQGFMTQGIGSKTKSYFWVNAFIREFIATIVSEKKTHIKVILFLLLVLLGILFLMYYFR